MRALVVAGVLLGASTAHADPTTISQADLEALRDAGTGDFSAFDAKGSIEVNVCISETGTVTSANVVTSTGNTIDDQDATDEIAQTWHFKPYQSGGKAIAVCADMKLLPAPPPPPPPPKVETVTPQALEAKRVSGKAKIVPDKATRAAMKKDGKTRVIVPFKLCVDVKGHVENVKILKSSGYQAYDDRITATAKKWKYRPYKVNGKAAPVCTAVTIIYAP